MILMSKYKCGYQINPKVCSSTICHYFANVLDIQPNEKWEKPHHALRRGHDHGRGNIPAGYYIFGFVRNPWSRLVSGYHELIDNYIPALAKHGKGSTRQDKKWASEGKMTIDKMDEAMGRPHTFDRFIDLVVNIEPQWENANAHWDLQCNRLQGYWDTNRDRLLRITDYDFIGRFETFKPNFKHVLNSIKCDVGEIPWEHKLLAYSNKHYRDFYTNQDMINRVGKHYEEDADTFKYTF